MQRTCQHTDLLHSSQIRLQQYIITQGISRCNVIKIILEVTTQCIIQPLNNY